MVVVGAAKGSNDNDNEKDNQRLYDNDNDNENYLIPIARRDSAAQTHATLALYDTPSCSAGA